MIPKYIRYRWTLREGRNSVGPEHDSPRYPSPFVGMHQVATDLPASHLHKLHEYHLLAVEFFSFQYHSPFFSSLTQFHSGTAMANPATPTHTQIISFSMGRTFACPSGKKYKTQKFSRVYFFPSLQNIILRKPVMLIHARPHTAGLHPWTPVFR
jgi:hypothetical protein